MRLCLSLAVVVAVGALGSGCGGNASEAGGTSTPIASQRDEPQAEKADGGVVQFSDYEQSLFDFRDCMSNADYELVGLTLGATTQVYTYNIPEQAIDDGTFDLCYEDLESIDERWQTEFGPTAGQAGDQLENDVQACLVEQGFSPENSYDNMGEMLDDAKAEGLDVFACL